MKSSRPGMPSAYGLQPVSGEKDLLPWSWAEERLAAARNYWICSSADDGRPHAMPVWGVWVEGGLLFSTARRSRKGRNLLRNPAVVVHLESGDEVVILEGRAVEATERGLLERFRDAYEAKYAVRPDIDNPSDVTFLVRPQKSMGWTEAQFPTTATRWIA